jgi:ribosomal protein S18 acetylase RimI-like enzyme
MSITLTANGPVDPVQLNNLYSLVGWDDRNLRTVAKTSEVLRASRYFVAAHTDTGALVGFARVAGDPYVVQVLDVITHPDFRLRGIATACMRAVVSHLQSASYLSVTLTDGSGLPEFYERLGFMAFQGAVARVWVPALLYSVPAPR